MIRSVCFSLEKKIKEIKKNMRKIYKLEIYSSFLLIIINFIFIRKFNKFVN